MENDEFMNNLNNYLSPPVERKRVIKFVLNGLGERKIVKDEYTESRDTGEGIEVLVLEHIHNHDDGSTSEDRYYGTCMYCGATTSIAYRCEEDGMLLCSLCAKKVKDPNGKISILCPEHATIFKNKTIALQIVRFILSPFIRGND